LSLPERAPPAAGPSADGNTAPLEAKLVQGIEQIPAARWDACVGPEQPFLRHAFLAALESSGSACGETGWLPLHLVVERSGELLGCAPMYLKSHSYGEYVFDWGWADAYERAGGRYYPKLQVAVPFTPVPGPRLLLRPGAAAEPDAIIRAMVSAAEELGVSSLHVTFCREDEWHYLARRAS
jgi:predicted N-acyltransferase